MTRKELIERLHELDVFETKTSATETLDALLGIITSEVAQGNEVHLGNHFGTFKSDTQAARAGTAMGVEFNTPAKKVIKFKPSAALKSTIATA